jgi:hypothetical protein
MDCYKGFYYVCAGMIYKLQGFSIKIFFDFEIEIDFNRGGGYTSRSRGGGSAENSDKNKKTFDN